jgi:hypothetical protein
MRFTFFIVVIASLFIWNCEESQEPGNSAPSIEDILYSPSSPETNSSVTFNTIATDADGDSLTYNWSALVGSFSSSGIGNPMNWYITEQGEIEITCTVSDGKEIVSKSISVLVAQEVGSLVGYVYDSEDNENLIGASISIADQTTNSLVDGSYEIQNIITGSNQILTASLEGYEDYSYSIHIYGEERTKDIYLEKETGDIFGYVYDFSNNQPVSSVQISIEDRSAYSGSNGYYNFSNISLGEHIVWAMESGYQTYSDTLQVIAGDNPYDIYIVNE